MASESAAEGAADATSENAATQNGVEAPCVVAAPAWVSHSMFTAQECSVCFEEMGDACPTRRLACGHAFHHSCIQRWLQKNASCPICKADAPVPPEAKVFKLDLGHQEMAQIMTELEDIFLAIHNCAGPERPVALNGLAYNLCVSLGYEDEDELEEAICGSLADFLNALPHFKVHWPDPESTVPVEGATETSISSDDVKATMLPQPSAEEVKGPGSSLRFTVSERDDLWRVVLQGPNADIDITELEFSIRPRGKRRVDTIYNFIASAIFHLSDHVSKNIRAGSLRQEEVSQYAETIEKLNTLLDVEEPFTLVIRDKQGISEMKPMVGVHVEPIAEDNCYVEKEAEPQSPVQS